MTRLHAEWQRLYLPHLPEGLHGPVPADHAPALIDDQERVRAMVLTLGRPADWAPLSTVWQAVQTELALPAPGIAVSGVDAFQLWFSLAEAVPAPEAHGFLDALRERYLGHIPRGRIDLLPTVDACTPPHERHAALVPARQAQGAQWSAFVAPDLAPMFTEAPWLDLPPSPEGQAELLSGLRSITPAAWQNAREQLRPAAAPGPARDGHTTPQAAETTAAAGHAPPSSRMHAGPWRFLLQVMNDESAPLALRIEAAKALLPYTKDDHPGRRA